MVKRKASAKFLAAGNAWRAHLSEFRKKNPNLSLKQQMKGASKTYKKGKSSVKSSGISFKTSKYEVKVNRKSSKRSKKRRSGKKKRSFSLF